MKHAGRGDLFEGLSIWEDKKYRQMQGTYPVIFLSFANIKGRNYQTVYENMCQLLADTYADCEFILDSSMLAEEDRKFLKGLQQE